MRVAPARTSPGAPVSEVTYIVSVPPLVRVPETPVQLISVDDEELLTSVEGPFGVAHSGILSPVIEAENPIIDMFNLENDMLAGVICTWNVQCHLTAMTEFFDKILNVLSSRFSDEGRAGKLLN